MFFQTIIRKTVTGIMQAAGGFAEPISRALGVRVRTTAGSVLELTHDDTNAKIDTATGDILLNGYVGGRIGAGTTAQRTAAAASLGMIWKDSDLGLMLIYNGTTWETFGGVDEADL